MGILGDTFDEFKKASPQEKIFIVGGGLAVLAIALYIRSQSQSQNTPSQAATPGSSSLLGGGTTASGGIQTVPAGANTGSVPILPQGLNPVFDAAGNLIAYQPITQSTPITPSSTPTPSPTSSTSPLGTIWTLPGQQNWQTVGGSTGAPLVPFGYAGGTPSGITGQTYSYQGQTFTQVAGAGGRIWGVPGTMSAQQAQATPTKELLYAPKSAYPPVKSGGGAYGTNVLSARGSRLAPRIANYTQPSQVARIYALRGK